MAWRPGRDVGVLAAAALLAGLLAFLFHAWAGNTLPTETFAKLGIVWTCIGIVSQTVGVGLEQWTVREATVGYRTGWGTIVGAVAVMTVLTGAGVWVLLGDVLWTVVASAGAGGLGVMHWGKGVLIAGGRAVRAAVMLFVDSCARLLLVPVVGWAWAIPAGAVAAATVGFGRSRLNAARRKVGAGMFIAEAGIVGVGYQLWLGAAPLFMWAVGASSSEVATVFLVFLLARAPLTLLFAVQTVFMSRLVSGDRHMMSLFGRLAGWAPIVATVGAASTVGAIMLPGLVHMMGGNRPSCVVCGLVAGGVMACGMVQLLGQQPAAVGRPLVVGKAWLWAGTVGASIGMLMVPLGMVWTATVGFAVGCAAAAGRTVFADLFTVRGSPGT